MSSKPRTKLVESPAPPDQFRGANGSAVTQAVSAMRKARESPSGLSASATMRFLVFEDNGGGYHWTILVNGGECLVQSGSFASYDEAEQAAQIVRDGASTAVFEKPAGDAVRASPARR
jgi:uncharacterized protein YegP (UPF0339 family)